MTSPAAESPEAGPWLDFYGFRLPSLTAQGPESVHKAVEAFSRSLLGAFGQSRLERQFDDDGWLRVRDRPGVAGAEPTPRFVYDRLREALLRLRLTPEPPPFEDRRQETDRPRETVNLNRQGISALLGKLFQAFRIPQGTESAGHNPLAESRLVALRPKSPGNEDHLTNQFTNLQGWLEEQWERGALLPAIERWHQQELDQRSPRGCHSLTIPRDRIGAVHLRINQTPMVIFWADKSARSLSFKLGSPSTRATVTLEPLRPGVVVSGFDFSPVLAGLFIELRPCGAHLYSPDARIACSEEEALGLTVDWVSSPPELEPGEGESGQEKNPPIKPG